MSYPRVHGHVLVSNVKSTQMIPDVLVEFMKARNSELSACSSPASFLSQAPSKGARNFESFHGFGVLNYAHLLELSIDNPSCFSAKCCRQSLADHLSPRQPTVGGSECVKVGSAAPRFLVMPGSCWLSRGPVQQPQGLPMMSQTCRCELCLRNC